MPITTHDYEYIRELVRQRSGIVLEAGKEYLVDSRIAPLARKEGLASSDELVAAMRTGPKALALQYKVVEAMTTNETSFFRDVHPFESLRDSVIPHLLKTRAASRTLNIWCAASSSGQEPYTIAIVLREHFGHLFGAGGGWKLRFIATDLSGEMVRRSREGKYSQLEINRGLPANYLVKYFQRHGMEWQIEEPIRKMVEFRELNLCEDWPFITDMDVVFMRNVLIYFSLETKRQILAKVRRAMKPDGYLFLGGAETTINIDDAYDRLQTAKGGIYQVRRAA